MGRGESRIGAKERTTGTLPLLEKGEKKITNEGVQARQSETRGKGFLFHYFHGGKSREHNFQNEMLLEIVLHQSHHMCVRDLL